MPELPQPPSIKFGVWDRYGREVNPNDRSVGEYTIGFKLEPSYYYGSRTVAHSRQALETYLPMEIEYYQRNLRQFKLNGLSLYTILAGLELTDITHERYSGLVFHLARGGEIRASFRRQYWQTPTITLPESRPMVVKRVLKTEKTFRLENGESIELSHYGKLQVTNVPDWLLEELYG